MVLLLVKCYYHTFQKGRDLISFKGRRNQVNIGETEMNVGELVDMVWSKLLPTWLSIVTRAFHSPGWFIDAQKYIQIHKVMNDILDEQV